MQRSFYDIIIIGADLPALIYGAICAKRGFRVLLIGNGSLPNNYRKEEMPMVRTQNLFWGLQSSSVISETFKELILTSEMRTMPEPLNPFAHVILPDRRIELTLLKGIFEQEIRREFTDAASIFEFYNLIPQLDEHISPLISPDLVLPPSSIMEFYNYFKRSRPLKSLLKENAGFEPSRKFENRKPFISYLMAPLLFMSGIRYKAMPVVPFVKLISGMSKGFYRIESGMDALKSLFVGKIQTNSGDCYLKESVDAVGFKRGGTMEVKIRGREGTYGCKMIVCGTGAGKFLGLIHPGDEKRKFNRKILNRKPAYYNILINVVVNRKVIPEGMADYAFMVFDPEKPLENENLLMVSVDNAMEPIQNKNRAVLTISSLLRADSKFLISGKLMDYFKIIFQQIENYIPFFENEVILYDSPVLRYDDREKRWELDRESLRPVYDRTIKRTMGMTELTIKTAYRNILYLGSEIFCGLGFEGAFLAAMMASNITEKRLKLKK